MSEVRRHIRIDCPYCGEKIDGYYSNVLNCEYCDKPIYVTTEKIPIRLGSLTLGIIREDMKSQSLSEKELEERAQKHLRTLQAKI